MNTSENQVSEVTEKLISHSFAKEIENAFNRVTSRNVNYIVRAYYVYTDLKGGIAIEFIEKTRLVFFKRFLEKYLKTRIDDTSTFLLSKVDSILA